MAGETEFEDILIKHGILKDPKELAERKDQHVFDMNEKSCDEEDAKDTEGDDDYFEQYRVKRMAELCAATNKVAEISRPEFVEKVTEASKTKPVLVHLYNDSVESSLVLKQNIQTLATQYPMVGFVEILASRCIPDYPDDLVPTILYYRNGNMLQKVTRFDPNNLATFLNAMVVDNKNSRSNSNSNNIND